MACFLGGRAGHVVKQPATRYEMFEGRFYSFWFATVAILCLLLSVRAKGIWQAVCVAAVGAMMCSIHYFGIITLGLIAVSQFCCNSRDIRQSLADRRRVNSRDDHINRLVADLLLANGRPSRSRLGSILRLFAN